MPASCRIARWSVLALCLSVSLGCATARTTDTPRTGIEQLLISNAVDQALDKFEFGMLQGRAVYIDDKYLDCVDKSYLLSSIRERALCHGARVVSKAEEAEVVLEIRAGAMGTDNSETFIGTPRIAIPGLMPVELPEVKFWNWTSHFGTAKIGILAYQPKSGTVIPQGGQAVARSDDTKWYVLGIGPFGRGSVKSEISQRTAEPFALTRFAPHSQRPVFAMAQPTEDDEPMAAGQSAQPATYQAPSYPPPQYR